MAAMTKPPLRVDRQGERLRLLHVHAHPDDESSKGAASTAKYVAEGVEVVVATCTGGERGSILNPNMDRPDVLANMSEIRRQEMDRAREILGVRQVFLVFVDSGLPEGDPLPPLPEGCFGLMDVDEAADFSSVGEQQVAVGPSNARVVDLKLTLVTLRRATTATAKRCTVD